MPAHKSSHRTRKRSEVIEESPGVDRTSRKASEYFYILFLIIQFLLF